ncbi:hypothetical protein PC123_g19471 [Phytophthora cactorum]|nr:hypothetical protein PC120_g18965 [Phytophthora cactorum]KAG4045112.1 hypothetical protein PC123_g19471 [Phytophthora cactorum]
MMQSTYRVLDKDGKLIRASAVTIPRNRRETLRSKYADFWLMAELGEMAALKVKGVLKEILCDDVPGDAKPINTRWVHSIKSDHEGYVIRSRLVLLPLEITRGPESIFWSFRASGTHVFVSDDAAALYLQLYGGDINTAYLNALLGIREYLMSIDGFLCEIDGHMYVVVKALYGLRQSGREWNLELNRWLLEQSYQRSLAEPCLYDRFDRDVIMLDQVNVDDIVVATNDEQTKCKLFNEIDNAYGIEDQGLYAQYLGIEVEQTEVHITICQSKYAREILVGQLSRFVAKPSAKHVGTLQRVLKYLAGTVNYGIMYDRAKERPSSIVMERYCDSDWANDPETRNSTTGFVFVLAGGAVS